MPDLSRLRLHEGERAPRRGPPAWMVATGIALVAALGLAGAGVAALLFASVSAETPQELSRPALASAAPSGAVTAGGYVEAPRSAEVAPTRPGVVHAVHTELGHPVEQGDLLISLAAGALAADVSVATAEVEAASARLLQVREGARPETIAAARADADAAASEHAQAARDLERAEQLAEVSASVDLEVARTRFDVTGARAKARSARAEELAAGARRSAVSTARAELAQAEAALLRAEAVLAETQLRAPFAGIVARLDLQPGEAVEPMGGAPILIIDPSELWVRVDVPETRIRQVAPGASAEVRVDALGGAVLAARVVEIRPTADRQSNTVEVAVRIEAPPPLLRPDMSARVTIFPEDPP